MLSGRPAPAWEKAIALDGPLDSTFFIAEVDTPSDVYGKLECVHRNFADPYPLFGLPFFSGAFADCSIAFRSINYIPYLPFCQGLKAITLASCDRSLCAICFYE
jgi:hypothetical protein